MIKVFIDGSQGTTGLRIHERLGSRKDITLQKIGEEDRKDPAVRAGIMDDSDIVFLCLPDAAAKEAAGLLKNDRTIIIDTSTAHRTAEGWTYGFPELCGMKEKIAASKRIANPGCHASGYIALVNPLVEAGLIKKDALLTCFSLTGYSGGGKKMIGQYEDPELKDSLLAPRQYGLTLTHKHLPEMVMYGGLDTAPVFCPIVSSYYSGMQVTVSLFKDMANGGISDIKDALNDFADGKIIVYRDDPDENGFLSAGGLSGSDRMELSVYGNDDRMILVSRFDNLGKGASGAAIENMNIVMGQDPAFGLDI